MTSVFSAKRFDENPFTCLCVKRTQRGLRISDFAHLCVVYKWRRTVPDLIFTSMYAERPLNFQTSQCLRELRLFSLFCCCFCFCRCVHMSVKRYCGSILNICNANALGYISLIGDGTLTHKILLKCRLVAETEVSFSTALIAICLALVYFDVLRFICLNFFTGVSHCLSLCLSLFYVCLSLYLSLCAPLPPLSLRLNVL